MSIMHESQNQYVANSATSYSTSNTAGGQQLNGLSLIHPINHQQQAHQVGSPNMKLSTISECETGPESRDSSNREHETRARSSVSSLSRNVCVQPSASDVESTPQLPSFDGFLSTAAARPVIDVHQYVQDMKLSSYDLQSQNNQSNPYHHQHVQQPSSVYWAKGAPNGTGMTSEWKSNVYAPQSYHAKYSNGNHASGNSAYNHQVYPSPEEKSPPTPASFVVNSPPFSNNNNSYANHENQSYSTSGMMSPPSSSTANPSSSSNNYSSMDQDALVSMFFTQSKPLMENNNDQYAGSNFSGSYSHSPASNSYSHQHQSHYHHEQQQDTVGALRINTRPIMSMPNGMASSLPSSLASARSSMDMSFFSSPLSESILMNIPSSISATTPKSARGGKVSMSVSRRPSQKSVYAKTSAGPYSSDEAPREQRLKFPGDLYTPKWVRYQGAAKEGLCDLCEGPGKWLQLKNSAFWYHKQFVHGISSVTSLEFSRPLETRLVWMCEMIANRHCVFLASEGYCHCCNDWVVLAKNRKRHSQTFEAREDALKLLGPAPLSVVCYEPAIKAVAIKDAEGNLVLPAGMKVTGSMVRDLVQEPLGSTWFRHAFKCHAAATAAAATAAANAAAASSLN